jgi:hypothetical protein
MMVVGEKGGCKKKCDAEQEWNIRVQEENSSSRQA